MIIKGGDNHFRTIVKEQGDNYFLLDSFNRRPIRISAEDVENWIRNNIDSRRGDNGEYLVRQVTFARRK